jgi:hypothetical protein
VEQLALRPLDGLLLLLTADLHERHLVEARIEEDHSA